MEISNWDKRFLELAEFVSKWSKDPSTKVGAVIAKGNEVISLGYNGFPKGILDSEERLLNKEFKYDNIVHGEHNAILRAPADLSGCTLYTYPFGPCISCCTVILTAKISRVVFPKTDNPKWGESVELSKQRFTEAGIEFVEV